MGSAEDRLSTTSEVISDSSSRVPLAVLYGGKREASQPSVHPSAAEIGFVCLI